MIDTYKEIYNKKELPWGRTQFYQSCAELDIEGERDTEKRFNDYKLEYLLDRNMNVLDIGSNCGFLSLFVSKYVNKIIGVEKEQHLFELANKVKDDLNINNCYFIHKDFESFTTIEKYDVIFSFAEHLWIGMSFVDYIKKIKSLLKLQGLFFIESHKINLGLDLDFKMKLDLIETLGFTKLYEARIDEGRDERILAIFRLGKYEIKYIEDILEANGFYEGKRLDINLTCSAIKELLETGNSELYKEYHTKRHGWKIDNKNFEDLLNYVKISKENSLFLKPIQIDINDKLFDGCHRLSSALYNKQKYILTEKINCICNSKIDKNDLLKNGIII